MGYKERIYILGLSRIILCQRLNLSYQAFCQRLLGYVAWGPEERELQRILDAAEQAQAADRENAKEEVYRG